MFWKLFSSERKIQEALEKSVGYDISPNVAAAAETVANANTAETTRAFDPASMRKADNRAPAPASPKLELWTDYAMSIPANTQEEKEENFFGAAFEEPWETKKSDRKKA